MDVARLRVATAADHEAVEGAVPLMDAGLSLPQYVAVLKRMHGVVRVWEEFALGAAPPSLLPLITARARLGLLEGELQGLGVELPVGGPELPRWESMGELLGAMYVMEGSRLGGQIIARHVEEVLGVRSAFFLGFEGRTSSMWKEFVGVLEDEADEDGVIRGAREMFGVFGGWMKGLHLDLPEEPTLTMMRQS